MKHVLLWVAFLLCSPFLYGQSGLYMPLNIQKAYKNQTRNLNGMPGNKYWQNKASYRIQVKLEPDLSKVTGSQIIIYQNNSPDTLRELVLTVFQIFKTKKTPGTGLCLKIYFDRRCSNNEVGDQRV